MQHEIACYIPEHKKNKIAAKKMLKSEILMKFYRINKKSIVF